MSLKRWQWLALTVPPMVMGGFLTAAAAWQIHAWGLNWLWGVYILAFLGWRWLLVRWTRPAVPVREGGELTPGEVEGSPPPEEIETALQEILTSARRDLPLWEDWPTFWQRCQEVVAAAAHFYHPEVKYPLLNIYLPQASTLMRKTVDDLDRWMQELSPTLNQVTVGQAYRSYEIYRQIEPSARRLWQIWNGAQWLLNPAAALAQRVSQRSSERATQELVLNLNQLLREAALRNLARQAIALYGGPSPLPVLPPPPAEKAQTLGDILAQAEPVGAVEEKPANILLLGRTGAGKSSLANTLFQAELAAVDVLPSTARLQSYHWQAETGETLTVWDTPGYEQVGRSDWRQELLEWAARADLLLLATPALDPALSMDLEVLQSLREKVPDLPTFVAVTQVDRLRPFREWNPPYDWQGGDRPKEIAIREATEYRAQALGEFCDGVLPAVTASRQENRAPWGVDALASVLVEAVAPAKQLRLARFLRDREARTAAAAQIVDRYSFQMAAGQGLAAVLKSPVLHWLSTLTTGSPALAHLLAAKIPVEQLPLAIGKLQMAYELSSLLSSGDSRSLSVDLLTLWPLLLENSGPPDRNAWAFGRALVEYWSQPLSVGELQQRFEEYLT